MIAIRTNKRGEHDRTKICNKGPRIQKTENTKNTGTHGNMKHTEKRGRKLISLVICESIFAGMCGTDSGNLQHS